MQQKLDTLCTDISDLKTNCNSLENNIAQLSNDRDALQVTVAQLSNTHVLLQRDLSGLRESMHITNINARESNLAVTGYILYLWQTV